MTDTLNSLLSPLYASAAMRAIMSDRARLQRMLDFEAALARAEAAVGIISASGAVEIADACRAEHYDLASLIEAATTSDFASAMVAALTAEVARQNETAAGFVHWGASSQDVIDTALALELRAAIDALLVDLDRAIKSLAALAGRHRRALIAARVQMQHALPVPFGLKLAGYAAALARSRDRLVRLRREALVLQFGGTAGTLASYAENGIAVTDRLAALLDLPIPEAPWHSHRDRLAELGACFAILTGTCGKVARDVALLMQVEIGEAAEPAVSGTAPTSRRARNPSAVAAALSAAAVAPSLAASLIAAQVQENELGLSGPQTEWTTFPMLALVTSGAVEAIARIAEGMEIDIERMRENLELGGARIMAEAAEYALAEKIGRAQAHALVRELSARADNEGRPFKELLLADPRVKAELTSAEVEKTLIPLTYLGSAQFFLDRLMLAAQPRTARRTDFRPSEPRPPGAPQSAATPAPSRSVVAAAAPASEPQASAPLEAKSTESPKPPQNAEPAAAEAAAAAPADEPELPLGTVKLPSGGEAARSDAAEPEASEAAELVNSEPLAPERHVEPTTLAAAEPESAAPEPPEPVPQPEDGDAPGAFMDVLSRAEAEAQALAEAAARDGKRGRS